MPCPNSWISKLEKSSSAFLGGSETTCEIFDLLPETTNGWVRDALVADVQICTEVKAPLTLPGLWLGMESTCRDVLPMGRLSREADIRVNAARRNFRLNN